MRAERIDRETKYLWFREVEKPGRKTRYVEVISRSQVVPLGEIVWYGAWRQYVFEPRQETIWNTECLRDVIAVVDELNAEQRAKALTPTEGSP